jgi:selenophosphate synthase
VQVKKAMTLTEKILANHSGGSPVKPGDNIWTRVDKLMTHDVCGPGTFGIFQKEFGEAAQVRAGAAAGQGAEGRRRARCASQGAGLWLFVSARRP